MDLIARVDEDAMLMAWAEAERNSPRHRTILIGCGIDPSTQMTPALARRTLAWRGYPNNFIFKHLPLSTLAWSLWSVLVAELGDFLHINYPTFEELTQGTRLIRDGAENVEAVPTDEEEQLNQRILETEKALCNGAAPPPLIAVAADESSTPVVMEGNTRASAYLRCRAPDDTVEVILGTSPEIDRWVFFGS